MANFNTNATNANAKTNTEIETNSINEPVEAPNPEELREIMYVSPSLIGIWRACLKSKVFPPLCGVHTFLLATAAYLVCWAVSPATLSLFLSGFGNTAAIAMTCMYAFAFAAIMAARLYSDFANLSFPHAFMLKGLTGLLMSVFALSIGICSLIAVL